MSRWFRTNVSLKLFASVLSGRTDLFVSYLPMEVIRNTAILWEIVPAPPFH